jgi:hypothetical protein
VSEDANTNAEQQGGVPSAVRDRLVLGFDAGCTTCSGLARRIEEKVGDKLEVVSLLDPEMGNWRKQALGEDAPWAPTLVEVRGGKVRAWTGLSMGLTLSRRLGAKNTWQVMQTLGKLALRPRPRQTPLPLRASAALSSSKGSAGRWSGCRCYQVQGP